MRIFLKILLICVLFVMVLGGISLACLQSPAFWQWSVKTILPKYGYEVTSCKIDKVVLRQKPDSYLQNVQIDAVKDGVPIKISIADIRIQLDEGWKTGSIFLSGLNVHSEKFSLERIDGRFKFQGQNINGPFTVNRLAANDYEVRNISGIFVFKEKETSFEKLQGELYKGQVYGKILLESGANFAYSIELNFQQIDLKELAKVNPQVFEQVSGMMNGVVSVKGSSKGIRILKSSFTAPGGGQMKATLFSYIINYIPGNSQQRKMLEALIKANAMVPLNQFDVDVKLVHEKKISLDFKLFSKSLNLQPNVVVDVNLDEKITRLLSNLAALLPKGE